MKETISSEIYENLSSEALKSYALSHGEAKSTPSGAISVVTGKRTGRSVKDKFFVKDKNNAHTIQWGKLNQPIDIEAFNQLWERTEKYLQEKTVFISYLCVGADDNFGIPVKVITESAWHNLFARHLFINPESDFAQNRPHWTILSAINFKTDPQRDGVNSDAAVMLDLSGRRVLICGMAYAGEMKKAMFTVMNYLLPDQDVLPMHCAANMGEKGDVALFFGLSGTGKTTLSADPDRYLIGDDEHGWSKDGVFNFEGGCYAKCIHLSKEREPVIWQALRNGAIMENVVLKGEQNEPDFSDETLTQNTRAAYPREFIEKRVMNNRGGIPSAVIFLTCDLYGVLPPVALLDKTQAAYHFLSGYTALVGSTQMGGPKGISTTFSVCFGAPFFPRPARVYADLLMKRLEESNCPVYLINTGWTGGAYGQGGERFSIPVTRAVVQAAVSSSLNNKDYDILPGFNLKIPKTVEGVDQRLLIPHNTWPDKKAYNIQLNNLIQKFQENFAQMDAPKIVADAGPQLIDV